MVAVTLTALPDLAVMDAALFDLDGTLVDSERVHRAAWMSFFDSRGWEVSEQTYADHFLGRRGTDTFRSLDGPWTGDDPDVLLTEVLAHLSDVGMQPQPVNGAADLVRGLHGQGVAVAVVTSAVRAWVGSSLEVLGVADLVQTVVGAEDVRAGKPDPEGYLQACRRLGVDPGRVVAFEDSTSGVAAAAAAGISPVIGVLSTTCADALLAAGAHHLIGDFSEVTARH